MSKPNAVNIFQGRMRLYLLIVLVSVFPGSFSKVEELKIDLDFTGDDVKQIYSPDVQHCQLACTQHHSCAFFTFFRSDWSKDNRTFFCYLKHTATGVPLQVTGLKGVISGFRLMYQDYKKNAWLSSVYQDVDFTGSEYLQLTMNTSDDCQNQCTRDPDCKFFSYTTETYPDAENRKKCFLKFDWTVPTPSAIAETPGAVSGFSDSLYKTEENCEEVIFVNIHYRGNDFENVPAVSPNHCQFLCTIHPHCTHFTYTTSKYSSDPKINMHCFLKHTQTVSQLVPAQEDELFSGLPTRNCKHSNVWANIQYEDLYFLGYDYRDLKTETSEACQEMCTKDPDCTHYTYDQPFYYNEGTWKNCFLKFRWTVPIPLAITKTPGVISGFSVSLYKTNGLKEECKEDIIANIHYRGNDFENVPAASPHHCQFLCSTHPRCTHFTYTTSNYSSDPKINLHCFLKHMQNVSQLVPATEEELFSGFSTRNCKLSDVWATTRYEGLHFSGYDYRDFKTDMSEICQEVCTKDPDCHFYTYVLPSYPDETIRKKCFLKFHWTVPIPSVTTKSFGVVSGFSNSLYKMKEECKEEIFANIYYRGNDIENVPAVSSDHCHFLCRTHPHCSHFTYTTTAYYNENESNMHCFLKQTQNVSQLVPVTAKNVFSGFPTRNCKHSNAWTKTQYYGLKFVGSEFQEVKTDTPEICQEMCTRDPDCHFYSYVPTSHPDNDIRSKCFLNFRWTVPIPSVITKTPGVVSGFSDSLYKTNGFKEDCEEVIFAKIHYRGNDFENVPAASPHHCQFLCTIHPHCTHFTYTTSKYSSNPKINMHCFLKNTQNVNQLVPVTEDELFSGFSTRNCKHSNVWATTRYEGLHFAGYDYRDFKTDTSEICRQICTSDPDCSFYTYVLPSHHDESIRKKCFLKFHLTVPIPSIHLDLRGVLSGFSGSLFETKKECKEEIFANMHFRGNDFENVPAVSPHHCQFLCTTHPHCTHFTYSTSKYSIYYKINMQCYLKHSQNGRDMLVREKDLFSGVPTRNCKHSNAWAERQYQDFNFFGYDFHDVKTDTPEICQEMCRKDPDCHFYSYVLPSYRDKGIRKKCFLKFRWTASTPSAITKTPGVISGFSVSLYKTNAIRLTLKEECQEEIFANIHYRGNDFENVPAASPHHCQFLCSTHPRCTHFTYTTSNYSSDPKINMHCFLKNTQNVSQLVPVREEELFSGFPTRNCKHSNVWATTRYEGLHFAGYDYRDFETDTSENCRKICTRDPDCSFYTYVLPSHHDESIRNKCFLKFHWTVPIPPVLIKTPGVVSGFSDSLYKTNKECKKIFANIHYRGNDFENIPAASPHHCQLLCTIHPHCTHFTYTTSKYSSDPKINMHCFLKHTQNVSQLASVREEELFSGFPTRNCKHSNVWATRYEGLNFLGDDYRYLKTDTYDICRELCRKDPECHFYTYILPSHHDKSIRHGCYLKKVMTLSRPEKVVYRNGVLSGFSPRTSEDKSTAHLNLLV